MVPWLLIVATGLLAVGPVRAASDETDRTQWIAVVAPDLRESIEPLVKHRKAGGFRVVVIDARAVTPRELDAAKRAAALQMKVRKAWQAWEGPSTVLFVGAPLEKYVDKAGCVFPALAGTVGRMKGAPSDNAYGCVEGELLPRVAVGRFPARTPAEAKAMVNKTLAWETGDTPGIWKRRFVLLAGAPSYNPVVDRLVENLAISRLGGLDHAWTANVIYHNPDSQYTLPVARLREQALTYLSQGQLLTVFLGHSGADGFWFEGWTGPYFSTEHWSELKLPPSSGILATFGCYGTQYDGPGGEGYGLYAMRNPTGPVAVIGSHWACWPAMVLLLSEGMLRSLPGAIEAQRLGELWLAMKRHLARAPLNPLVFRALDAVGGDPNTPEADQRREHLEMFLLLGDPALRLPCFSHRLALQCPAEVRAGATIRVQATLPPELANARGHATLERTLASQPLDIEAVAENLEAEERDRILLANHERANRFVLVETPTTVQGNQLSAELRVPEQVRWNRLVVRLYVSDAVSDALGAKSVAVRAAP